MNFGLFQTRGTVRHGEFSIRRGLTVVRNLPDGGVVVNSRIEFIAERTEGQAQKFEMDVWA